MNDLGTQVSVSCPGDLENGRVQALSFRGLSPGERGVRAIKRLSVTWALAGMSLGVPAFNGVLFPLLLLLGPLWAMWGHREGVVFSGGTLSCPKCPATLPVREGMTGWPLRLFCEGCGTPVDAKPAGRRSP
jgi:hypothetical protein